MELVRGLARKGPWKSIAQLELAASTWVHWQNTECLHRYVDDIPPTESEAMVCGVPNWPQKLAEVTLKELC